MISGAYLMVEAFSAYAIIVLSMESLIDLKAISLLPKGEQVKIKKMTINLLDLDSIPAGYLPEVVTSEYCFISYSHLDYRKVYADLFDLGLCGLSFWYDRGMPAGKEWKEVALRYLAPFECKCVLFYVSENFLLSDSIVEEINFAVSCRKPYAAIFMGEGDIKGLVNKLFNDGKIDASRRDFYLSVFKDDAIYLPLGMPAETKVEKIKKGLPSAFALSLDLGKSGYKTTSKTVDGKMWSFLSGAKLAIKGLNDYYASKITKRDFEDLLLDEGLQKKAEEEKRSAPYEVKETERRIEDIYICPASFANMKNLELVELPRKGVTIIGKFAFFGCEKLEKVDLISNDNLSFLIVRDSAFKGCVRLASFDFNMASLGASSFSGCSSLSKIDLSNLSDRELKENVFTDCVGLEEVIFPRLLRGIGEYAFAFSGVKTLDLPKALFEIHDYAFTHCLNLREIRFNEDIQLIGKSAFETCSSVEEITLPSSLKSIGSKAFQGCSKLRRLAFRGSFASLLEIAAKDFLMSSNADMEVVTLDRTVRLSESPWLA